MLCAAIAALLVAPAALAADSAAIVWLEDWGAALKQAKQENRLLMVDFYTSWCLFCKNLERESFVDPRIVELSKDFVCTKLDADVVKAATMRYRPEGYPTIIFASATGDEIVRVSGYRTPDQIFTVMKTVRDSGPKIAENLARLDKDRKDVAAHEELGRIYLELGLGSEATEHLAQALKYLPAADKAAGGDAEPAGARLQLMLARAQAADEDCKKATKTLEKLVAESATAPYAEPYYAELEKVYTACEKQDLAAATHAKREQLFGR
ncbi:MAG: thioredoxin family protein [Acidobacteria bacterium]|nr:thioredoxin family protein [Acidobacteriota bacterium]